MLHSLKKRKIFLDGKLAKGEYNYAKRALTFLCVLIGIPLVLTDQCQICGKNDYFWKRVQNMYITHTFIVPLTAEKQSSPVKTKVF